MKVFTNRNNVTTEVADSNYTNVIGSMNLLGLIKKFLHIGNERIPLIKDSAAAILKSHPDTPRLIINVNGENWTPARAAWFPNRAEFTFETYTKLPSYSNGRRGFYSTFSVKITTAGQSASGGEESILGQTSRITGNFSVDSQAYNETIDKQAEINDVKNVLLTSNSENSTSDFSVHKIYLRNLTATLNGDNRIIPSNGTAFEQDWFQHYYNGYYVCQHCHTCGDCGDSCHTPSCVV